MSELDRYIATLKLRDIQAWGFAVYRTVYGPGTDAPWQLLLDTIRAHVRTQVLDVLIAWGDPPRYKDEDMQKYDKFISMFKLDVKEDQNTLEGLSMDGIRNIIEQTDPPSISGETFGGSLTTLEGAFLYVDDEVLEAVQTPASRPPWIKMVELDYEPERHKGNSRIPRNYFGWMKLSADSLYDLWDRMQYQELYKLAPKNEDERLLTIWDGGLNDQM